MAFDPTTKHPLYDAFAPSWRLMRDAADGEDAVKARGEAYLPMKSGIVAMADTVKQRAAYDAYKLRAEFPEMVGPTVRGAVGTILDQPATIELPAALEPLREKATRDGLTLEGLHRRIAIELITVGRYGVLPGVTEAGTPYLAGYVAESIINWDATDDETDFLVLDETGLVRNRDTGAWETVEAYLECFVNDGAYTARRWTKASTGWVAAEEVIAQDRKRRPLGSLPFAFIGTNDLTAAPDDVPLYGLAKLAVRVYRLDADFTFALHMTSEPTPVAIGFDDPKQAIEDGKAPTTLGSSKLWILPVGGDAKYLEFSGPGLERQEAAINGALGRAVVFGAQILSDSQRTAESGEAIRLRLGNQASTLKTIAFNSAGGLEKALKNLAVWMGANPDEVKVTPVTDFFDHTLSPQEITAIVAGWQAGAYSKRTMFDRFQRGELIPVERTFEDEQEEIANDPPTGLIPPADGTDDSQ